LEAAINYLQNKCNISCHFLKTSLHYRVNHKSLKMLHLLYQFLITNLRRTFMLTLWIINWFEKHFYQFGTLLHCFNDRSLDKHSVRAQNVLLWPLHRREDALSINCAQLHIAEGRAKCPKVPQRRELMIGTRVAGQGSK